MATKTLNTKIQLRRDTAANLANVILAVGEPGFSTDTKILKIGDGVSTWSNLPAINSGGSSGGVSDVTLDGTSVVTSGVAVLPAYPTVPTNLSSFTNDVGGQVLYQGGGTSDLTVSDVSHGTTFLWYGRHNGNGGYGIAVFTSAQFTGPGVQPDNAIDIPCTFTNSNWYCPIHIWKNSNTALYIAGKWTYGGDNNSTTTDMIIQIM